MKSRFWAIGLACFLLFCVAPASALAASVSGKMTAVGGAPIPGARACVHDVSGGGQVTCAQADEEGDYAITALTPDEYKLYFEEPQDGPEYVVSYWPEKATFDEGVPFRVTSGEAIEANATLVAAGRIEGTLTGEGEALPSGEICAYKPDGIRVSCAHVADESGYRIRDLAPASYVVDFTAHGHLPEYSGGVKEFADATPVTVQAGAVASASADLESEPGVSGTVTALDTGEPIEGVQVCVEKGGSDAGCVYTDEDGKYTFYLFPGTYSVRFELDGYVTQYYDDVVDSADATTVTTTYGSLVRGVDAALEDAGSITGHVTTTDGQADLGDVIVCALGASSEECVGARQQTGAYEFRRLAPGSYKVRFSLERHFTQYFDDKATEAEAQSVTVTADHETGGVDARLVAEEAPTNVTPPFVSGVGKIGETLSCSNGVWDGNPPIFTYEYFWFRGEDEIEGAESSTYRLTIADAGESISCAVVVTNSAGEEYEFSSNEIVVPWLGTLSVTRTGGGSGTVTSAPAGIFCGVSCTAFFEQGTAITLTAIPDSGSEFSGWSGACSGGGPCVVTLGGNAVVVARFSEMRSVGGGQSPSPPATAVKKAKKRLRCKVGFRKEKRKGKIRCVKAKSKQKRRLKAKGLRG